MTGFALGAFLASGASTAFPQAATPAFAIAAIACFACALRLLRDIDLDERYERRVGRDLGEMPEK
jgi:hypothetical protein